MIHITMTFTCVHSHHCALTLFFSFIVSFFFFFLLQQYLLNTFVMVIKKMLTSSSGTSQTHFKRYHSLGTSHQNLMSFLNTPLSFIRFLEDITEAKVHPVYQLFLFSLCVCVYSEILSTSLLLLSLPSFLLCLHPLTLLIYIIHVHIPVDVHTLYNSLLNEAQQ